MILYLPYSSQICSPFFVKNGNKALLFSFLTAILVFIYTNESKAQEIPPPTDLAIIEPDPLTTPEDLDSVIDESAKPAIRAIPVVKKKETPDDIHRTYLQKLKAHDRFPTAASCGQCHPDHYDEWSVSPHAYAMVSPVFNSMQAFLVDRTSGTLGDFCIRCHTPVGMEQEHDIFGTVLHRPTPVVEGVSCIVCHRVNQDFGNISGRFPFEQGPITEAVYGPSGNKNLEEAIKNEDFNLVTEKDERGKLVHRKAVQSPVISRSAQCAFCHDVNSPAGIRLESAFTEYKRSPAAKEGISCQDCHMNKTPGKVLAKEDRYSASGIDKNYHYGPVAKVRNSPTDPTDGMPTADRKRTNHMFIGPDYSIVHPGIFPHSAEAMEFTYANRFKKVMTKEAEELAAYVKKVSNEVSVEKQRDREISALRKATREAGTHARSDWITFRWWEGWGTPEFEEKLSDDAREVRLKGVGFPWNDKDDPIGSKLRRETARLILARQFNLLNRAHVERTRVLRRGLQFGNFEITKNDKRGLDFRVDIHNPTNGHGVPTGFDAERAFFLEVTVRDGNDRVLFQSGDRDPNGDIRDLHSAFVHAQAPKEGHWLEASSWKEPLGLRRTKDDFAWLPDRFLFSLQSKFVVQNLVGGEREQVLPVPLSIDPLPFIRPPSRAFAHTGRAGPSRKMFRNIPPLGKRSAHYQLRREELTGTGPYSIRLRLIAQMVPVNLIKSIASVGFDYNLSPREVAQRVAFGHVMDHKGTRKGGAVTLWDKTIRGITPGSGSGMQMNLRPSEAAVVLVPEYEYPFPIVTDEELAARRAALSSFGDVKDFMIQNLGPLRPEIWPAGVPEGLPMLPPIDILFPSNESGGDTNEPNGSLFPPVGESPLVPPPPLPKDSEESKTTQSDDELKKMKQPSELFDPTDLLKHFEEEDRKKDEMRKAAAKAASEAKKIGSKATDDAPSPAQTPDVSEKERKKADALKKLGEKKKEEKPVATEESNPTETESPAG